MIGNSKTELIGLTQFEQLWTHEGEYKSGGIATYSPQIFTLLEKGKVKKHYELPSALTVNLTPSGRLVLGNKKTVSIIDTQGVRIDLKVPWPTTGEGYHCLYSTMLRDGRLVYHCVREAKDAPNLYILDPDAGEFLEHEIKVPAHPAGAIHLTDDGEIKYCSSSFGTTPPNLIQVSLNENALAKCTALQPPTTDTWPEDVHTVFLKDRLIISSSVTNALECYDYAGRFLNKIRLYGEGWHDEGGTACVERLIVSNTDELVVAARGEVIVFSDYEGTLKWRLSGLPYFAKPSLHPQGHLMLHGDGDALLLCKDPTGY